AWSLVGSIPGLVGTEYGRLLLLKIAFFFTMIALAAVNRQRLTPALADPGAARRLARNAAIEAAMGFLILADVAVLGISVPAAHDQPLWPFPITWSLAAANASPLRSAAAVLAIPLTLVGLVALLRSLVDARSRARWAAAAAAVIVALGAAGIACSEAAVPTVYVVSPLAYSVETLAAGQQVYFDACATCHGAHGYGDGPTAAGLARKPADLARRHVGHHSDGTLYWWVTHGRGEGAMPAFSEALDDRQRWAAVSFLRLQSDAEAARALGPAMDPALRIPAPDFAMERGGGAQETLASLHGRRALLLVLYTIPDSTARLDTLAADAPALDGDGLEVAALPLADSTRTGAIYVPGDLDLTAIYSLFARPAADAETPPRHLEFLIDRWGYLRARWIGEGATPEQLAAMLRALAAEPPPPPPESGHHH
ncbi:MAG: CopD family protein, partial [Acidobacteriota bacterium]